MSRHEVPQTALTDPLRRVAVGYNAEFGDYWYSVAEPGQERLGDDTIRTLPQLVEATWALVDWTQSKDTLRKLHADAGWVAAASTDGRSGEITNVLRDALEHPLHV